MNVLEVDQLEVTFFHGKEGNKVVKDVSFAMKEGEIVGIVGESGSGKTQTSLAIMQLLNETAAITGGTIRFCGNEISSYTEKKMQEIRGKEIGMIFQEPMTALNPVHRIGQQIEESLKLHTNLSKLERKKRAMEVMKLVELPNPEIIYHQYPHQLSGGMRQRIMIASALIMEPKLLIADEPTTALDVTIQAQILTLLKKINQEKKLSILFISHDLGVIHKLCHRVVVMKEGKKMEEGDVEEVFHFPKEDYTKELLQAIPTRRMSFRKRRKEGVQ